MVGKIWSRNFILLTLSNFLVCTTYYAIISALPIYLVSELNAGKSEVGIVLAAYTIASVLIRPFSGFALDKFGRRTIFLLAIIFYSILFSGYLFAASIASLIILRFLQGLTWGGTTISGSTIAVDITPTEKRGEGIGYFSLSTTMGMPIGPVVGLFICHLWGYTAMFASGLGISVAALICATAIKLPKRYVVGRKIHFRWSNLFDRNSVWPSLNLLVIMTTYGGLLSFIALYGREIGIENASMFFSIFAVGIIVSRLLAGKIFDRKGPSGILTFCLLLMMAGFSLLAFVKSPYGFYASALIIGFGIGVIFPTYQAIVNNLSDNEHRGAANSTVYTALDIGMGLGMVVAGFIADMLSITAVFTISVAICLGGLILFRTVVLQHYEQNRVAGAGREGENMEVSDMPVKG